MVFDEAMKRTPLITVPEITVENRKAIFWPCAFFVWFAYSLSGHNPFFDPWHPQVTSFDLAVPFIPETVWIYLSHVGFIFTAWWWCARGPGCTRTFWTIVMCSATATTYFLFFPTEISRVTLEQIDADPVTRAAWAFLLSADKPTNLFPSLHVAEAILTAVGLTRASPRWSPWAAIWATAIILTTITTRQHVWVDVIGGGVLALCCWWIVERFVAVSGEQASGAAGNRYGHGSQPHRP